MWYISEQEAFLTQSQTYLLLESVMIKALPFFVIAFDI